MITVLRYLNDHEALRAWIYRMALLALVIILVVAAAFGADPKAIVAAAVGAVPTLLAVLNTTTKPPAPTPAEQLAD